jgi:hypothetical protein
MDPERAVTFDYNTSFHHHRGNYSNVIKGLPASGAWELPQDKLDIYTACAVGTKKNHLTHGVRQACLSECSG